MIFINNKYTNWYNSIISNAQARGFTSRKKAKKILGYVESHHIIPKSLSGSNFKENKVYLTAKEHFVCHHLLTKMTLGIALLKMQKALSKMMQTNEFQQRVEVSAKLYEQIRVNAGKAHSALIKGTQCGKNNPFFGKHHSEETKKYLGKLAKARPAIVLDNEARLKISVKQKGVPKSQAHCDSIKASWDKEARSGVNHPRYGARPEKIPCPHCGVLSSSGMYARWHGENCRTILR